jgi:hypothetical protein
VTSTLDDTVRRNMYYRIVKVTNLFWFFRSLSTRTTPLKEGVVLLIHFSIFLNMLQ